MQRFLLRGVAALVVLCAVAYAGDWMWLRVRMSRNPNTAFDTVQVQVVEQIPQKGNKAEYVPEEPQPETCVRALFPHGGNSPCWYLRGHATRQVNF